MYKTISKGDFRDAFKAMGRGDQFSYEGLGGLYDYLEEHFPNEEMDVIAYCCTYVEMGLDEVAKEYDCLKLDAEADEEAIYNALNEETVIVWNDHGRVLFQQF